VRQTSFAVGLDDFSHRQKAAKGKSISPLMYKIIAGINILGITVFGNITTAKL
jgi:hypothetical protein